MDITHTAKDILDKYLPMVIRKNKVFLRDGNAQVDNHEQEKYDPTNYSDDIVLQVAPKDAIVMEFEDEPDKNKRYISEIEEACRVLGLQYCVSSHGGKSDYLRIYNIKGMPVNYDNKLAKNILIDRIVPPGAKAQLDKTNLGWTLSPVIGHPHWKPKYNGTIHQIIRGTHPLDQKNEYPKDLLLMIKKAKKVTKTNASELLKNNQWVNDFLTNYCTTHLLPGGARHHVIEKNLSALVFHRDDRDQVIEKYLQIQQRTTDTTRTWMNAIANGGYAEVSVLEIKRYIREHNIQYEMPKEEKDTPKPVKITEDHITLLKDPNLILNIVNLAHDMGVVGEENTLLTLINKINLRLVPGHKATSSNMVVSDVSGAGKDAITGAITKIMIPEDKLVHRTRFSDKALEYMMVGKDENETLDGTVFYLEDPEDEMIKSQAFRVMASGQNKATVVKDQEILELSVKGKPVIIVTSMNTTIDLEGERRWDAVQTDTSETLTKLVMKEKLRVGKDGPIHMDKPSLVQAVQCLKPNEVVIPYAEQLFPFFEKSPSLIMRTQIDKFLDYIKSSAVLHQYQREKTPTGKIIADDFDYEYSKYVFAVLGDAEGGMLNPIEKKLIEILKLKGEPITINELCGTKGFPRSKEWMYKHFEDMKARHVIGEISAWDEKANRQVVKIFNEIGTGSVDLPSGLHLYAFVSQLQMQNMITFNGFNGFLRILKEINKKRDEVGLSALHFEDMDKKNEQSGLDFDKCIKTDKCNPLVHLESADNTIQMQNNNNCELTELQQDIITNNNVTDKKDTNNNVTEYIIKEDDNNGNEIATPSGVRDYVQHVEDALGKGVTDFALMDKFPDYLIMELVNRGFLIPVYDDSGFKKYTWDKTKKDGF